MCAYIEVAEGTPEYDEATHHFKQTLGLYNVTIAKVQRVQNPGEYMRYEAIKACWHQTTEGNVKEETVFHGTKRANIEPISKTGFNRIFAAEANGKVPCYIYNYNFLCLITATLLCVSLILQLPTSVAVSILLATAATQCRTSILLLSLMVRRTYWSALSLFHSSQREPKTLK